MKSSSFLDRVVHFLWALTLVALPVTSFRYFPFLGDGTVVRPLALYPIVLLLPLLFIQRLKSKSIRYWPQEFIPLVVFLLAAGFSTAIGAHYAPIGVTGNEYWGRAIRAWFSIFIGLSFFLSAMWACKDETDLRFTLKWLAVGLALNIIWSGIQSTALYTDILSKATISGWQKLFSMRGLVGSKRISGLAYEPSWLTGQLNTIYLPWLLAGLLLKFHTKRDWWLNLILLLGSIFLIILASSRGGVMVLLVSTSMTLFIAGREAIQSGWKWFFAPHKEKSPISTRWRAALSRLVLVGITVVLLWQLYGFFLRNGYFSTLWNAKTETWIDYIVYNNAGSRLAYAWASMEVFQLHPFLGVGLGASGFYLFRHLPDWAYTTVYQIVWQLSPRGQYYLNPKNLYLRLLSETGVIGFFLFVAFYVFIFRRIRGILYNKDSFARFVGVASLYSWIAIVIYCFLQDSFATPNIWLNLGILIGVTKALNGDCRPITKPSEEKPQ